MSRILELAQALQALQEERNECLRKQYLLEAKYNTKLRGEGVQREIDRALGSVKGFLTMRLQPAIRRLTNRVLAESEREQATPAQLEEAQLIVLGDPGMVVDDDALASRGDDGALWVQAWVKIENAPE